MKWPVGKNIIIANCLSITFLGAGGAGRVLIKRHKLNAVDDLSDAHRHDTHATRYTYISDA